jgi:hypothetical protein
VAIDAALVVAHRHNPMLAAAIQNAPGVKAASERPKRLLGVGKFAPQRKTPTAPLGIPLAKRYADPARLRRPTLDQAALSSRTNSSTPSTRRVCTARSVPSGRASVLSRDIGDT